MKVPAPRMGSVPGSKVFSLMCLGFLGFGEFKGLWFSQCHGGSCNPLCASRFPVGGSRS